METRGPKLGRRLGVDPDPALGEVRTVGAAPQGPLGVLDLALSLDSLSDNRRP